MSELEATLREKSSEELQHAIRCNMLVADASRLACGILAERGAPIPTPKTEADDEAERHAFDKKSRQQVAIVVVGLLAWLGYCLAADLFDGHDLKRLSSSVFMTGIAVWFSLTRT